MKKTTEWDRAKLRVERKRFKMLALLYANKELLNNALLSELHQSDRRYYKLLKKYKRLKKELEMCEARWKMVEPPVRLSNAVEDVLKKEWDTPEEDKAWEGLLDSSSEVKE